MTNLQSINPRLARILAQRPDAVTAANDYLMPLANRPHPIRLRVAPPAPLPVSPALRLRFALRNLVSFRRRGGLRFLRIHRLNIQWSISKPVPLTSRAD